MKKLFFILVIIQFNCKKDPQIIENTAFDIIVIMGQSNTQNGYEIDSMIDKQSEGIMQLGRHAYDNFKIIDATDPLQHWDPREKRNGFGLPFAKLYKNSFLTNNRKVLLIPCGKGNTGFADGQWNKGDVLYNDVIDRVNWVKQQYKNSKLKAILWQQAEKDILLKNPNYQECLDALVKNIFNDLAEQNEKFVFIAGGMVPYWVNKNITLRMPYQNTIKNLPLRIENAGYADPYIPFVISKLDNDFDTIHYNAEGQRELAKRYFTSYQEIAK